ncbi:MAG: hypothetical protein OXJ53_18375 [Gammaproteobacteria bacterium]|nr:hypothetical protein [Gammaproteobacteria bacterium]MDE0271963.1 hypothetical protein [Gammaproteobacteria bacterium]
MAAAVLTIILTFIASGSVWLAMGPKFALSEDEQANGLLNLGLYFLIGLPLVFAVVFAVIG